MFLQYIIYIKAQLLTTLKCGLGKTHYLLTIPLTHRSVSDAPDPAVEERASLQHRGHIARVLQLHLEHVMGEVS